MDYLSRANKWLKSSEVTDQEKEIIRNSSSEELKEMFSSDLEFGTGGMRALLGPGSSRLNCLTVRRATIGACQYLKKRYQGSNEKKAVAISFDNRHCSKEFRDTASKVFTEYGFDVYTFKDPHPTPELSYTVRHLGCVAGVMITASHNPKVYNGYKLYDEEGCQCVYKTVDDVIESIHSLPDEIDVSYQKVDDEKIGKITYLDEDDSYDEEFIKKELTTSLYKEVFTGRRKTKIIFTPQCGCDCKVGPMALTGAGYSVKTVPTQDKFDPDFTGTPNPNPETEEAYLAAIDLLKKENEAGEDYNLILCTDPDADRCGLAFINSKGKIERFTGNQTGALLIDFILGTLKRMNKLPVNGYICNTFVTSNQGAKAASLYGVKTRTTATGFKYIGNMIDRMKEDHQTYLFGYEESYGYLLADFIRDKDSLQSIVAIADMNEYYLRQGKTLDIALQELDLKTKHHFNTQVNIYFKGEGSLENMLHQIDEIRNNPPKHLGDKDVVTVSDYLKRKVINFKDDRVEEMNLPDIDITNCIRFDFSDDSFLAIRPSGTEPKMKFYIEIVGKEDDIAKQEADKISTQLKGLMGL